MRAVTLGLGLIVLWGCADEPRRTTVSTGDAGGERPDAGGAVDAALPSPRPDGGPDLPPAEHELQLPYGAAATTFELSGEASLGLLDIQLSVDTSASIDREIDTLQTDLMRHILPELRELVPQLSVGVSRFEDFPIVPFGLPARHSQRADRPYELLTPITSSPALIDAAVTRLDRPLGNGGDVEESGMEALFQIATGAGYSVNRDEIIEPFDGRAAVGGGELGGVGFRDGALHVVLHITDAPAHLPLDYEEWFPDTHTLEEAGAALSRVDARTISIVSGACKVGQRFCEGFAAPARNQLERIAVLTGAVTEPDDHGQCPTGIEGEPYPTRDGVCPLVFDVTAEGEGLSETFTKAISTLVDGIRFKRVTAVTADDPLGFVERIRPIDTGAEDVPEIADLLPSGAPDGEPDTFVDARAAAPLVFEVKLRNVRLPPRPEPQQFRVVLRILGDGLIVDERVLRIIVPPGELPTLGDEDAGH